MSKLNKILNRRIEKISNGDETTRPDIPVVGTNHVDNPNDWTDNTIYVGELLLNIDGNEVFTQDGVEQVALGRENAILEGLTISTSGASLTEINVSTGRVRIKGREYYFDSTQDIDDGSISIESNIDKYPRLDAIGVKGDLNTFNTSKNMYGVEFKVFKGSGTVDVPIPTVSNDYVFLGFVLVVPNQTISDVLRPRPVSTSDSSYPLYKILPQTFAADLISKIEDWKPNTLYLKEQVLRFDGNLYEVVNTFVSTEDIAVDLTNDNLIGLGGLSSSNITRFSHIGINPTDSLYTDGFFEWSSNTRILDAFDDISEFIKRFAPTKPKNIANANLVLNTVHTTAGISKYGLGNIVDNVFDSNIIPVVQSTNWFIPSTSGAIKSYYYTPLATYSTNNLVLTDTTEHPPAQVNVIFEASNIYTFSVTKDDPYSNIYGKQGFYTALNVNLQTNNVVIPKSDFYKFEIKHFSTGANANIKVYAESVRTPNVTSVSNVQAYINSGSIKYLSGLPILRAEDSIKFDVTVDNAVRYFYNPYKILDIDSSVTALKTVNLSNVEYLTTPNRLPFTELSNANSNSISVTFNSVHSNVLANSITSSPMFSITGYNAVGNIGTYITPEYNILVDDLTVEVGYRYFSGSGLFPDTWGNLYTTGQSMANIMQNSELQYFGGQYFYPNVNYTATMSNVIYGGSNVSYRDYTTTGNTALRWTMFKLGTVEAQKYYTFKIEDSVGLTYDLEDGVQLTNDVECYLKVTNDDNVDLGVGWIDANRAYNILEAENPFTDGDKALDLSFGNGNPDLRRVTFGTVERTGNVFVRFGTNNRGIMLGNIAPYTEEVGDNDIVWSEYNLGEITDENYVIVQFNGTEGIVADFLDGSTMTSDFYAQLKVRNDANSLIGTGWLDINRSYPADGSSPYEYNDPALDVTYYTDGTPDPLVRKVTFGPTSRTGNVTVRLRKTGTQVLGNVTLLYPDIC